LWRIRQTSKVRIQIQIADLWLRTSPCHSELLTDRFSGDFFLTGTT